MRTTRHGENEDFEGLRGNPEPSIDNLIRWERIKLREAAREAVTALENGAIPTREYLDYMWQSDVGMKELRTRMEKLRGRIAELEAMKADAEMDV